jgi:putative Mn2+ efflux pump MntP
MQMLQPFGLIFGLFETAMPIVGLVVGHSLASTFGAKAHYLGGGLLILTGVYSLFQS